MLLIRITNLLIFLFTTVCFILNFHKDGEWKAANGLYALRYFTILSNLLSALAALLVALNVSEQGLPFGIWLLKYVATAAVTVTFLTVMVFLGPTMGYKSQLEHAGFYYHAAGPLMAVLSFCFMERFHELSAVSQLFLVVLLPAVHEHFEHDILRDAARLLPDLPPAALSLQTVKTILYTYTENTPQSRGVFSV